MTTDRKPHVVVIGGGFAGLLAARTLSRYPVSIKLIDRRNHHTFQPLLYQVATAGLSPGEIAAPIRWILRGHPNVQVLLGEVQDFDLQRRVVKLPGLEIPYDYLVVATGAWHAYFGHDEWEPLAPGLKTVEDALEIRRRVLLAFELAENQASRGEQHDPLNFVVVGGGPTGWNWREPWQRSPAGYCPRNFVPLTQRAPAFSCWRGTAYPPSVFAGYVRERRAAVARVRSRGSDLGIGLGHGAWRAVYVGQNRIPAAVILWAAGVAASPLGKKLGAPTDRAGRVLVNPDLSIPGHPEVFAIGDLASLKDDKGKPVPGLAPAAMQQGKSVAHNIARDLEGKPRQDFRYLDKGSLATIGRSAAVAEFGKIHISGFFAWLAWLFIHIFFLIGFRNRLIVFIQWAWSYLTYERGARLITGESTLPGWSEAAKPKEEVHQLR